MKKRSILFGFLGLLFVSVTVLFFAMKQITQEQPCAFCNAEVVENQKFYESDLVLGLCSHKPVCPGHCLIIPKRHVEKIFDLTDQEILEIFHVLKKIDTTVQKIYGPCSCLVLQKKWGRSWANGASCPCSLYS